jgi:Spy/CpxP family protein refolding chaperone
MFMSKNHSNANKERRREEARQRQEAYDKLTPEQKVAQLDKLFGQGKGAKRQRARLAQK